MATEDKTPQKLTHKSGTWLIVLGVVGFVTAVVLELIPVTADYTPGALPAVSFFLIMLGMAFVFPDMLQDGNNLSTMRVIVYMVVSVFVIVAVKIGWEAENFDDFKMDRTWVYILGLAFGSKVFQSFSENLGDDKTAKEGDDK